MRRDLDDVPEWVLAIAESVRLIREDRPHRGPLEAPGARDPCGELLNVWLDDADVEEARVPVVELRGPIGSFRFGELEQLDSYALANVQVSLAK